MRYPEKVLNTCPKCSKQFYVVLPLGVYTSEGARLMPLECQSCFDREFPRAWYRRLWKWLTEKS